MSGKRVLRPFMRFNHAEITKAWAAEWGEEPESAREDWELLTWQVLADGKLCLIYCLYDKVACDAEEHNVNHYRVLLYDMLHGMKPVRKLRCRLEDAYLYQVYEKDGEFWTVERFRDSNDFYTVPNWPVRDKDRGFRLFYDITTATAKSDGKLVVGYSTQRDKDERVSLIEFGDGQDRRYQNDKVLRCECIGLDKNEDEWALMVPQMELIRFEADDMTPYELELTGFDAFCLSDDGSTILTDYCTNKNDDRLYLMYRRGENYFGDAVECVIEDDHAGCLGLGKGMKNRMVFIKGDWLLGVDVNDATEGGKEETEKDEIGFKASEEAKTERKKKSKRKPGDGCGAEETHDGHYKKRGEAPQARVIGFRVA